MSLNRRWTGALAFGALALIVAVPSSEVLRANVANADTDQAVAALPRTGSGPLVLQAPPNKAPTAAPAAAAAEPAKQGNPVDKFLNAGKALPSYITDTTSPQTAAVEPEEIGPVVTVTDRQTGATRVITPAGRTTTVPPTAAAPALPPAPQGTATPAAPTQVAALETAAGAQAPLPMAGWLRERAQSQQVAAAPAAQQAPTVQSPAVVPQAVLPQPQRVERPSVATREDDWESGPTREYLGRVDGGRPQVVTEFANGYVDANGDFHFFNDEDEYAQAYDEPVVIRPRGERRRLVLDELFSR